MNRNLKFILILFPVILVGAYIYGLEYSQSPLPFLQTCPPQCEGVSAITIISCPEGFTEVFEAQLTSPQNNSKEKVCVGEEVQFEDTEILRCGDEYVDAQGMVETVECSVIVP